MLNKMPGKFLSITLPSRKRFEKLQHCFTTLLQQLTAEQRAQIEIILRLDSDDIESLSRVPELPFQQVSLKVLVGARGRGYADIYLWANEMARLSTGLYIMGWSDDAYFKTENWFSILQSRSAEAKSVCAFWFSGNPTMLRNKTGETKPMEWPSTPVLHRKLYQIMGCVAGVGGTDAFQTYVLDPLGLLVKIPEIYVEHTPWFDTPPEARDETARDNSKTGMMLPTDPVEIQNCQQRILDYVERQQRSLSETKNP